MRFLWLHRLQKLCFYNFTRQGIAFTADLTGLFLAPAESNYWSYQNIDYGTGTFGSRISGPFFFFFSLPGEAEFGAVLYQDKFDFVVVWFRNKQNKVKKTLMVWVLTCVRVIFCWCGVSSCLSFLVWWFLLLFPWCVVLLVCVRFVAFLNFEILIFVQQCASFSLSMCND